MFFGVQRKTCLGCKAARAKCQIKKIENKKSNPNKMTKPNAWVEHIKAFAAKNKIPYGCAISQPECKKSYHHMKKLKLDASQMQASANIDIHSGHSVISDRPRRALTEEEFMSENDAVVRPRKQLIQQPTFAPVKHFLNAYGVDGDESNAKFKRLLQVAMAKLRDILDRNGITAFNAESMTYAIQHLIEPEGFIQTLPI